MMDAVEFLVERSRLCTQTQTCTVCPLYGRCSATNTVTKKVAEEAVAIVEEWAKEHPCKTRKNEFLKLFPSANVELIHPCTIEKDYPLKNNCVRDCEDCTKRYRNEEIE